jgi:hypothetical protein
MILRDRGTNHPPLLFPLVEFQYKPPLKPSMNQPQQLLPFRKDERGEIERLINLLLQVPGTRKLDPEDVAGLHELLSILKRLPAVSPSTMVQLSVDAMQLIAGEEMFLLQELPSGLPPFAVCNYGARDGDAAALQALVSKFERLPTSEISISDMSISRLELDGPSSSWHLLD